jgi:hypothetical protein
VVRHHSHRDLACAIWHAYARSFYRAFPSRNAWFKQVCSTRGAPNCRLRSYHTRHRPAWSATPCIGAVSGTPSKRGGTQIEGQAEQQQQRHQVAPHQLLADVGVAHPGCVHISRVQCLVSLSDGLAGMPSLSATPSRSKITRAFNPACACTWHTRPTTLPKTDPASPATNCTRDAERRPGRASCGPLLPLYHELFRLHLW